jgi:MarR family transcriptional regulator, organic hydroperoxide resistance regulator
LDTEKTSELRMQVQQFIRLFGLLEQTVTPCGFALSLSQVFALQELEKATLSISELAEKLKLERSSVSRLVDILVKETFVHRELNEQNRREVQLHLTDKGKRTITKVCGQSITFYQSFLKEVSENEQQQILNSFKKFNSCLSNVKEER